MRILVVLVVASTALLVSGCTSPQGEPDVAPSQQHQIAIHGGDYHPNALTMVAGDGLRFENHEAVPHTATAIASPMGDLDSGDIAPNGGDHTFPTFEDGTYTFTCRHHANMRLTVSVTAD